MLAGLPHCHIAVRIEGDQPLRAEDMDAYVSAEIPDLSECPNHARGVSCDCHVHRLHQIVTSCMIHRCVEGHCYSIEERAAAAAAGRAPLCSRRFPFEPQDITTTDERGYVRYRRRGQQHSNVVPYSPEISLLMGCHCNVSISATVVVVKYLRKVSYVCLTHAWRTYQFLRVGAFRCCLMQYMCKGVDKVKICFVDEAGNDVNTYRDDFLEFEYSR
jgi:hypothetical protein